MFRSAPRAEPEHWHKQRINFSSMQGLRESGLHACVGREAHEYVECGHARGKVILRVKEAAA